MSLRIHPAGTKVFPLNNTGLGLGAITGIIPPTGGVLTMTNAAQLPIGAGGNIMSLDVTPDGTRVIRTDTSGAYIWDTSLYSNNGGWRLLTNELTVPVGVGSNPTAIAVSHNNSSIMYMAISDTIIKTTNRGVTWDYVNQPTGSHWDSDNSGGNKLSISRLMIDPNNDNHVLYGSQTDGLYRTTDGGQNWTQIPSNQVPPGNTHVQGQNDPERDGHGVCAIAFDSTSAVIGGSNGITSSITVAVDGTDDGSVSGAGIYNSTNGGVSWSFDAANTNIDFTTNVRELQCRDDGVMFLIQSGSEKMWRRSGPVGTAWTDISPSLSGGINSHGYGPLAFDSHTPGRMFSFTDGPLGGNDTVVISTDSGDTWVEPVAATMDNSGNDITWMYTEFSNGNGLTRKKTAFDPAIPNKMYQAEGVGVWEIDVGGATDTSRTVRYRPMSRGIEQLVAEAVVAMPDANADEGVAVVVGGWDRSVFRNTDRHNWPDTHYPADRFDSNWSLSVSAGNANFVAASIANHQDGYGLTFSGWSDDSGATWNQFNSLPVHGPSSSWGTGNLAPNALDWGYGQIEVGKNPDHMIWVPAYGHQPYYTTDRGDNWNPMSIPGVGNAKYNYQKYYVKRRICAADPGNIGWFYIFAISNGFYRTKDSGATWEQMWSVSGPAHGFPTGYDMTFGCKLYAPSPEELWFTVGDSGTDNTTPVARSTDGGATWTQIPIGDARAIGFGPPLPGATGSTKTVASQCYYQGGANRSWYVSTDDGATWTDVGAHPVGILAKGNATVGDPLHPGRFYAATGGIGWLYFDIDLV